MDINEEDLKEIYNFPSTSRNTNLNRSQNVHYYSGDNPASQAVIDETNSLYFYHLATQMAETGLVFPLENKQYIAAPRNASSLQTLANEFILSPQRRWVHDQAQNVDLDSLNFHTFQQLLSGLFQEGGVTWERVLVLFYFCTDLSIRALQEKLVNCFICIYNWTTCYITNRLSVWIEEQGGWDVVLQNSVSYVTKLAILGFCCIGILAICIYIRNSK